MQSDIAFLAYKPENKRAKNNSFDLAPYLREYAINEELPTWFLSSYTNNIQLRKIYDIAEKKVIGNGSDKIK